MSKSKTLIPGGVDEYIASYPLEIQEKLSQIRAAILEVAPDSIQTTSYFQIPGFSCGENYYYNGMFVWFSFTGRFIRLHVVPPVIQDHKSELKNYSTTASVISFPADKEIPIELVKKLTKASLKIMKGRLV